MNKKNADKDLARIKNKKLTDSTHARVSPPRLSSVAARKRGSCARAQASLRAPVACPPPTRGFPKGVSEARSCCLTFRSSAWMISLKRLSKKNNAACGLRSFRWCARCTFGLSLHALRESVFGKLTREIENVFPLESNVSVKFWNLCYAFD